MQKAIFMSVRSIHLVDILNLIKKKEIRTKFPDHYEGWIYLYCNLSKPFLTRFFNEEYALTKYKGNVKNVMTVNGKVVARFWLDETTRYMIEKNISNMLCMAEDENGKFRFDMYSSLLANDVLKECMISDEELFKYLNGKKIFKALHIKELDIFDTPKNIKDFKVKCEYQGLDCPCEDYCGYYENNECKSGFIPLNKAPQGWQYVWIEEAI